MMADYMYIQFGAFKSLTANISCSYIPGAKQGTQEINPYLKFISKRQYNKRFSDFCLGGRK